MKIALLTLSYPPQIGGVQTYLYETMSRLGSKYQVFVVTPFPTELSNTTTQIPVKNGNLFSFIKALGLIKPDLIIVGHAHPQMLLAAKIYPFASYTCITYGNDFLAAQTRWHRPFFNHLIRQAKPLITISRGTAQYLQDCGINGAIIIPPATDPEKFSLRETPNSEPILLTIGRLVPRKGIDSVIRLLPALKEQFPLLRYQIGGTGPDRTRLEKLAKSYGVSDCVEFLGHIPEEDLAETYKKASIFVMLPREEEQGASVEGFGIVYLEASASGLPIVATNSGGVSDAVRHNITGLLVPQENPKAAKEAIQALLSDADLSVRLGQQGRKWVETELNWSQTSQKLKAALNL